MGMWYRNRSRGPSLFDPAVIFKFVSLPQSERHALSLRVVSNDTPHQLDAEDVGTFQRFFGFSAQIPQNSSSTQRPILYEIAPPFSSSLEERRQGAKWHRLNCA